VLQVGGVVRAGRGVFTVVATQLLLGCFLVVGLEDTRVGPDVDGSTGDGGASNMGDGGDPKNGVLADGMPPGTDASSEAATNDCPGRGPVAIRVGVFVGNEFCVDTTEVTRKQYDEFLKSGPQPTHPRCGFKTSFVPPLGWPYTPAEADLPVVSVDWCDAFTFCQWAGKRLCGKIGGGSLTSAERIDFRKSQFQHACSHGGEHEYAVGDAVASSACNGPATSGVVRAGSLPACEGGFSGLFDMSGNVSEFTDSCIEGSDGGADDNCYASAGSYADPDVGLLKCSSAAEVPRNGRERGTGNAFANVGFRCCGP
jgi:formylglycine-generating enzyme required for sulfatase activity